jgi:HEAT repeat protein
MAANQPDERVARLVGDLGAGDHYTAMEAARRLGELGNPSAVPALCEALLGGDEWVAVEAADALGRIGDSAAVPALLEALRAEYWLSEYDEMVAAALASDAPDRRIEMAEQFAGSRADVRAAAARALGRIGDPRAVPALIRVTQADERFHHVRRVAIRALARIGTPEAQAMVSSWKSALDDV